MNDLVLKLSRSPSPTLPGGASSSPSLYAADGRCLQELTAEAVSERCLSVLFIGAYSPPAMGSRGVSEDLCAHLSSAGWPMQIVSRRASRSGRLTDMFWTVWNKKDTYEVAAVDLYSGPAFYWAQAVCWMLRKAGKPYILMLHGGNLPRFATRRPQLVRTLLGSAAAITTPSVYLMERMGEYAPRIILLPNAMDIEKYKFNPSKSDTPSLMWLRAFHEVYNPVMAVQTLARMVREFPEIRLTMIGPDKGDGSLQRTRQEAQRLGVMNRLTLRGPVKKEDVPNALAVGNIFLNTARVDNTPVSVMEAMASGLPVVSTNVGGIPYLLKTEDEALLVPSEDSESMAAAVRQIMGVPGLRSRLARNARLKAEQFDWSSILPRWEELFISVIHSSL